MYDFQPLGENSIRLLQIQPALKDGYIACILNQYNDHVPPYDALSYYWGDSKPTRKIYVNDSLIDIHEALWEFLNQMQRSQEAESWMWTDFLCLNQRNHTEMGHQVPRMGHIYSNAERTLSWLGCNDSSWVPRPDASSTPSYDLGDDMRLIAERVKLEGAAVQSYLAQPNMLRWTDFTKLMLRADHAINDMNPIRWHQYVTREAPLSAMRQVMQLSHGLIAQRILNILSLPYWTRAWIIQEVALAKEVKLIFGEASLDLNDFILIYKSYCLYIMKTFGPGSIKLSIPIEARAAVHDNNISFQQILLWGQHCKASKTVDRIYGLLGLLERSSDGTNKLPYIFTQPIDYTRDWTEIYWETVLTYQPLIESPIVSGERYGDTITHWVDLLPGLGESFSCPFTRESLQYADNERATPLCRNMARLALSVIDICEKTVMADITIRIKPQNYTHPKVYHPSWPTKSGARHLLSSEPPSWDYQSTREYPSLRMVLVALCIETAEIRDMKENDKYQAARIGWRMFRPEPREVGWNCTPHQSMEGSLGHNMNVSFQCQVTSFRSQPPCSSLSTTSGTSSLEKCHECKTSDRYLLIPTTGWRLCLKVPEERYFSCAGSLIVEY